MRPEEVEEALRTWMHYATAHPRGPAGTMPVLCSVCGLAEVVGREGFASRDEQFAFAKSRARAHVWEMRQREGGA